MIAAKDKKRLTKNRAEAACFPYVWLLRENQSREGVRVGQGPARVRYHRERICTVVWLEDLSELVYLRAARETISDARTAT